MKNSETKIAGRRTKEWEELSAELDKEMSGAQPNTQPLSADELRWYRLAALEKGPKVKVTIRLRKWQIERAKEIAGKKKLRGYQTVLDEIITRGLLS